MHGDAMHGDAMHGDAMNRVSTGGLNELILKMIGIKYP